MKKRTKIRLFAALIASVIAVSGCSDDDSTSNMAPASSGGAAATPTASTGGSADSSRDGSGGAESNDSAPAGGTDEDESTPVGGAAASGGSMSTDGVATPQPCVSSSNEDGGCECSQEDGFTTYTFEHDGKQRCLTVYVEPQTENEALPLVIMPDCYSENRLANPRTAEAARTYGFRYMDLTTPDGSWDFPLDNRVNDSNYKTQCDDASSTDIGYLKSVFALVAQMGADGVIDPNKVFVSGFSQNSMFSIFMATCFPDQIAAIWQGGSGLYSEDDGAKALPRCEGACTDSDFAQYDKECVEQSPCPDCKYFPVYPVKTGNPIKSCIAMYENDGSAHSTAVPGYKVLQAQGHNPYLYIFGADEQKQLGGHEAPVNEWAWVTHCFEFQEACTSTCETQVTRCIDGFRANFMDRDGQAYDFSNPMHRRIVSSEYGRCLERHADVCVRGCTATTDMLQMFETPACECAANAASCDCTTSDVPGQCE